MHAQDRSGRRALEKLTKRDVDTAVPPKRRAGEPETAHRKRWTWLPDGEVPGFGVKVYGSGRKVFALRYRTKTGRQRMSTLGTFGELTVQQARDLAREERIQIIRGEDPQALRQRQAIQLPTVRALLKVWIDEYAKVHRKRWEEDLGRIERHIGPRLGRYAVEDLSREVLASWHRKLGEQTPVEANRCLETLRAAWRWAESEGRLPEGVSDPTMGVKRFREQSRDRWLRKSEVARLMEEVRKHDDPHIRAAIPLFLLTGLRKSELLSARWENVDLERGEIRLPETKAGVAQVRVLPEPAVEILANLPRIHGSPFLFPRPSDRSKPRDDIKRQWAKIREDAGLLDITLHDLRRTAGSHMAQAGVPLQVIGEVLGHSHPGVTKLYARLANENERQALDTLAEALAGALNTPEKKPPTPSSPSLPERLQDLLDRHGDDPDVLADALSQLALGKSIQA